MKKILLFFAIFVFLTGLFFLKKDNLLQSKPVTATPSLTSIPIQENEKPQIVSTKPDPLEEAVVSTAEEIEITFSHPLENEGQFKIKIEPKTDYKVVLTQDRKTAKIIPQIPYELGAGYTLFILPDSKFDGVGEWKQEKIFHFKTIRYRGV